MATLASEMNTAELAALLHFYAESGVAELCEDAAIDRFQQSAEILKARARPQSQPNAAASQPAQRPAPNQPAPDASPGRKPAAQPIAPAPQASQLTIPGEAAFQDARALAAGDEDQLINGAGRLAAINAAAGGRWRAASQPRCHRFKAPQD